MGGLIGTGGNKTGAKREKKRGARKRRGIKRYPERPVDLRRCTPAP